jgi:hypothetical protein
MDTRLALRVSKLRIIDYDVTFGLDFVIYFTTQSVPIRIYSVES